MTVLSLRLPDSLAAQLRAAAARDHRSVNAELLFILERALPALTAADTAKES